MMMQPTMKTATAMLGMMSMMIMVMLMMVMMMMVMIMVMMMMMVMMVMVAVKMENMRVLVLIRGLWHSRYNVAACDFPTVFEWFIEDASFSRFQEGIGKARRGFASSLASCCSGGLKANLQTYGIRSRS